MPIQTTFGIYAAGHTGSIGGPAFVTATGVPVTTSTQSISLSGAAAGNLAIISTTSSATASATGWTALAAYTWTSLGYTQNTLWKILTTGDISDGSVSVSNLQIDSTVMLSVYTGVTSASLRETADATTGTGVSIPGFTKNASSKILVTWSSYHDTSGTSTNTPPGLAIQRIAPFHASLPVFVTALADIIPSSAYTNGSLLNWTGGSGSTNEQVGQVVELT
jgi:hypothetical protein